MRTGTLGRTPSPFCFQKFGSRNGDSIFNILFLVGSPRSLDGVFPQADSGESG